MRDEYMVRYDKDKHNLCMLAWHQWKRGAKRRELSQECIEGIFDAWVGHRCRLILTTEEASVILNRGTLL